MQGRNPGGKGEAEALARGFGRHEGREDPRAQRIGNARAVIAQATPPSPVICMETESPVICMVPLISSVYLMTKERHVTTNGGFSPQPGSVDWAMCP